MVIKVLGWQIFIKTEKGGPYYYGRESTTKVTIRILELDKLQAKRSDSEYKSIQLTADSRNFFYNKNLLKDCTNLY